MIGYSEQELKISFQIGPSTGPSITIILSLKRKQPVEFSRKSKSKTGHLSFIAVYDNCSWQFKSGGSKVLLFLVAIVLIV
jgi:hypothetical protein